MAGVTPGRIQMSEREGKALDALIEEHGAQCSVSRRDPGDIGPLIVEFSDKKRFQIDANGRKRDLSG